MNKIHSTENDKTSFSSFEKVSIYKKTKSTKKINIPPIKGFKESIPVKKVDFEKGFFSFASNPISMFSSFGLFGSYTSAPQETKEKTEKTEEIIEELYISDSSNEDSFYLEFEEVLLIITYYLKQAHLTEESGEAFSIDLENEEDDLCLYTDQVVNKEVEHIDTKLQNIITKYKNLKASLNNSSSKINLKKILKKFHKEKERDKTLKKEKEGI